MSPPLLKQRINRFSLRIPIFQFIWLNSFFFILLFLFLYGAGGSYSYITVGRTIIQFIFILKRFFSVLLVTMFREYMMYPSRRFVLMNSVSNHKTLLLFSLIFGLIFTPFMSYSSKICILFLQEKNFISLCNYLLCYNF